MRKNFFKKVLAVTLASTMAFSMVGCGNSDSKSEGKKDDGTITLNVWHQWSNDTNELKGRYEEAVKAYEKDNPNVKIKTETLKQETIKKVENRAIALVNNKIVYATGTQLKMMSLNGKDDQILFKNIVVSDLQVLGSDLFTKGYVQESGVKYIVFNIKGQYKALNENTAQEFENLQDA